MAERKEEEGKKKFFANKLLSSLTDAYSSMIFGSGIIHGDPHPGNIFVLDGAEIALIGLRPSKDFDDTPTSRSGQANYQCECLGEENNAYTTLKTLLARL